MLQYGGMAIWFYSRPICDLVWGGGGIGSYRWRPPCNPITSKAQNLEASKTKTIDRSSTTFIQEFRSPRLLRITMWAETIEGRQRCRLGATPLAPMREDCISKHPVRFENPDETVGDGKPSMLSMLFRIRHHEDRGHCSTHHRIEYSTQATSLIR